MKIIKYMKLNANQCNHANQSESLKIYEHHETNQWYYYKLIKQKQMKIIENFEQSLQYMKIVNT